MTVSTAVVAPSCPGGFDGTRHGGGFERYGANLISVEHPGQHCYADGPGGRHLFGHDHGFGQPSAKRGLGSSRPGRNGDDAAPLITCPSNQTIAADATCAGTVGAWALLSKTDNCTAPGAIAETQSPESGTVLSGHNDTKTVVLTATDSHEKSASCSFTVTLKDVAPPIITCPANQTVAVDASCAGVVGSHLATSSSDLCGSPIVTQSPAANTVLTGHNTAQTVTLTADDGHGNAATCSLVVTLKDVVAPLITCPANQIVVANGSCGGTVGVRSPASSSDNCGSPAVTQSPAASTVLSGHNDMEIVALTASDGHGNAASCSFTVTLKDQTPPALNCPADRTLNLNVNCQASLANYISLSTVSDNCTAAASIVRTQSPATGSVLSGVGVTIVTIAATDAVGNASNCTFNVNRTDVILPSITCPAAQTLEMGASCQAALLNYSSLATASDNCTASGNLVKTQVSPAPGTIVSGLGIYYPHHPPRHRHCWPQ